MTPFLYYSEGQPVSADRLDASGLLAYLYLPMRTIEAIYQDGVLKPVETLNLADHARVKLVLLPIDVGEDIPTVALHELAAQSGSFDFLADPGEDVYSLEDGEPI